MRGDFAGLSCAEESPPLHIILKGAVGRYALELPQETGHEDGHVPQATVVEHGDKQRQQAWQKARGRSLAGVYGPETALLEGQGGAR